MQFKEPELQDSTIRKVLGLSTTSPAPSPQPHSGQLALRKCSLLLCAPALHLSPGDLMLPLFFSPQIKVHPNRKIFRGMFLTKDSTRFISHAQIARFILQLGLTENR